MKKIYILTTLTLAMAFASCKKDFLSQEVNPNTPSVATPQQLLAGAENTTASNLNIGFTTFGIWLGYYAPSGNYTISAVTEQYNFTNANFSLFGFYSNITNYTNLVNRGAADPTLGNFAAIAKIMIALNYQMLVDNYNDVPYTQAENSTQYLFPAYDSGKNVIYPDLMVQLDAAIAMINASTSGVNPGSSDIIFGGNMANWKKFANTLKLRIAIRQSNLFAVDGALKTSLTTELAKTSSEGFLDDKTFAAANPGYLSSDANNGQQNPYWKTYGYNAANVESGGHAQNRANAFFVNLLKTQGNDTLRLKQFYAPTLLKTEPASKTPPNNADHFVGNRFGDGNNYLTNSNTSSIGPGILISPTMSAVVISGAEACFLQSEGILLGLLTGSTASTLPAAAVANGAQDYYQRGITANFVALQVPNAATAAVAYYSQPVVDVNWLTSSTAPAPTGKAAGESNLQRAILTQKYIALFGYSIGEEYNEYRRTALPDLSTARSVAAGALGVGPVPNRIFLPSSEASVNAVNYNAQPVVSPFVTTIFWARNVN